MKNKTKKNIAKYARFIILGLILCGTTAIHYLHIHIGPRFPSVHAVCPLGGLENLWAWVAGKANLQKLFSGTMTLFFLTVVFALIFGRAFCGNICPFGALQEFIGKITKKKISIPVKIDKILRLIKYFALVFITITAWITATFWISPYDPYTALAHIWASPGGITESGIAGFVFLIIILLASLFINRFFCKYFCPAGALYAILAKFSPVKIRRNKYCPADGKCSKNCPMNVDVVKKELIKSSECISCAQCVVNCPSTADDLRITIFGKMVKPFIFVIAVFLMFFGNLFALNKAGLFQLTVPNLQSMKESGERLKITDLRGMMDIETGAEYVGMGLSEFYRLMEIPETVPKETMLRDVSSHVPGWDFHVIRDSR